MEPAKIICPDEWGDASRKQSVRVNDLVAFGNRTWQVTGVHIGALGVESVATLVACDRKPSHISVDDQSVVPLEFLSGRIFRYTPPDRDGQSPPSPEGAE